MASASKVTKMRGLGVARYLRGVAMVVFGLTLYGATASARTVYYSSDYSGATVFRDSDGNGALDTGEPSTTTRIDGRFKATGLRGEGRLYLTGGIDIATRQENTLLLTAPRSARAIGTLTALWQALLDRGQRPPVIRKMLFMPAQTTVEDFAAVPLASAKPKSPKEILVKRNAQQKTLVQFLKGLTQASRSQATARSKALVGETRVGEDEIIGALADALNSRVHGVDYADPGQVKPVLAESLGILEVTIADQDLDLVTTVAAKSINQKIGKATAVRPANFQTIERDVGIGAGYLQQADFLGFRAYFIPAPTLAGISEDTGRSATDYLTRDSTPTFSGTAPPQAVTVRVYRNSGKVAEVPTSPDGHWSYTSAELEEGLHSFGFQGVTGFELEGLISSSVTITVDTTAPVAPTVRSMVTSGFTPTLTGHWSVGSGDSLTVRVNGKEYGVAEGLVLDATGWQLAIPAADALTTGRYDVVVTETDPAGNQRTDATTGELLLVTTIAAPVITALSEDTGRSATDGITRDTSPTLSGTVDPQAQLVKVYRDGGLVGQLLPTEGRWEFTDTLKDGQYRYTAAGVNAVGEEGFISAARNVIVDTAAPAAPTVTLNSTGSLRPVIGGGWLQSPGDYLTITVAGREYGDSDGLSHTATHWSLSLPRGVSLPQGVTEVVARVADLAGNLSAVDVTRNELSVALLANGVTPASSGAEPYSVVQGDFDEDGWLDLATANRGGSGGVARVNVLRGFGDGTFAAPSHYLAGATTEAVTAADFNGDGHLDLAAANYGSNNVSVLLGKGNGSFNAALNYAVAAGPVALASADFDGDGKRDLVTANFDGGSVSLLFGKGDGSFAAHADRPAGKGPMGVAVGDLDGDGRPDLAVANGEGDSVSALMNAGSRKFSTKVDYASGNYPYAVALADFNGDGKADLAVPNNLDNSVSVLLGKGDGTFQTAQSKATGTGPVAVVVGDYNGDGLLDLATANYAGLNVSLLLGDGMGGFKPFFDYPVGNTPISLATGDFNGDGKPDLAAAQDTANQISVLLGVAEGSLRPASAYPVGASPSFVDLADMDRDATTDIVVASYGAAQVGILPGEGNGRFSPRRDLAVGNGPMAVLVAELNGDGWPDLATANYDGNSLSVLLADTGGGFLPKQDHAAGAKPYGLAGADLDGDGNTDLMACNYVGNSLSVLQGAGDGSFAGKPDIALGKNPNSVAIVDLNGDGKRDLVIANGGGNTVSVLIGKGDGTFQPKSDYQAGTGAASVAAADVNGDGHPDVAVANSGAATVSVLLGQGDGSLAAKVDYPVGIWPFAVAAGDLNGDGKLDLAVANEYNGSVSVLPGIGDGRFLPQFGYTTGAHPYSVAIGDLNGDGLPDLVTADYQGNTVSVLLNNWP